MSICGCVCYRRFINFSHIPYSLCKIVSVDITKLYLPRMYQLDMLSKESGDKMDTKLDSGLVRFSFICDLWLIKYMLLMTRYTNGRE